MIDELKELGFFAVINTRFPTYRVGVFSLSDSSVEIGPIFADTLDEAMIQALVAARNWMNWVELKHSLAQS